MNEVFRERSRRLQRTPACDTRLVGLFFSRFSPLNVNCKLKQPQREARCGGTDRRGTGSLRSEFHWALFDDLSSQWTLSAEFARWRLSGGANPNLPRSELAKARFVSRLTRSFRGAFKPKHKIAVRHPQNLPFLHVKFKLNEKKKLAIHSLTTHSVENPQKSFFSFFFSQCNLMSIIFVFFIQVFESQYVFDWLLSV